MAVVSVEQALEQGIKFSSLLQVAQWNDGEARRAKSFSDRRRLERQAQNLRDVAHEVKRRVRAAQTERDAA